MTGITKQLRKGLPSPSDPNFGARTREALMTYLGQQGSRLDRGVTLRDLKAAGIKLSDTFLETGQGNPLGDGFAIEGPGGTIIVGGGEAEPYIPDLTPPPTPTGFIATPGLSFVNAECDAQLYLEGHGPAHCVLYGVKNPGPGPLPTFASAIELCRFTGTVYAYPTEPNTRWFLWLKWVTVDGVESISPAGGVNGVQVTTGQDVSNLLDAVSNAAADPTAPFTKLALRAGLFYVVNDTDSAETPLFSIVTAPIMSGGVLVPTGVYFKDGFIMNGTIGNLQVANAAIDNAKIANVSVSKLTAGTLSVGEYIQSSGYVSGLAGFRINGAGNIEANNAILRGTVYVGAGSVGGIIIEATRIRSTNYDGAGNGFSLSADGVLDLPDGSVNAQKLNVGFGKNLLKNSTWMVRSGGVAEGWSFSGSLGGTTTVNAEASNGSGSYTPLNGQPSIFMFQNGRNGDSNIETAFTDYAGGDFPCEAGERYEYNCYLGAHRCTGRAYIGFKNASGVPIAYMHSGDGSVGATGDNAAAKAGGRLLTDFKRTGGFAVAPAGAASAFLMMRKGDTMAGETNSYLFMNGPYIAPAGKKQIVFTPYNPTGQGTLITPAGIQTPSLAALNTNLGTIAAGQVTIGSNAGGDWGFIRSPGKWLDGNWGWIMAQHPNGSMFVDFTIGSSRFYMHHDAGVSARMAMDTPGLYFDSTGTVQLRQQSIVNTGNIVANAVTVPAYTEASDQRVMLRVPWTSYSPILSIYNFDSGGSPIFIVGSFEGNFVDPFGKPVESTVGPQLVIQRSDGAVVWSTGSKGAFSGYFGGAGNAHYHLYLGADRGSPPPDVGQYVVTFRNLFLMACRR